MIQLNKLKDNFDFNIINVEVISGCPFNCYFCEGKDEKFAKVDLATFKYRIETLAKYGFNEIILTPTSGDLFLIPNIDEYFSVIENTVGIDSCYFYFSIPAVKILNFDKVATVINKSKKITMVYSCYWTNDNYKEFNDVTNVSEELFNIHRKNAINMFNKIDRNLYLAFRNNEKNDNNPLTKIARKKNFPIMSIENDNESKFLITGNVCSQYLNCMRLNMEGNFIYCLRPYVKTKKYNIKDIEMFKKDAFKTSTYLKVCKNCNFYDPMNTFNASSHKFPMMDF